MSTRNPMNERYTSEEKRGVTRKSAASAKPKTKAAATVYIQPTEKTPQEKKAIRREERRKEAARQQKYYRPDTPRYRRLRRLWWGILALAIATMILSWTTRGAVSDVASYVMIGVSYLLIIAAFVLEFTKVRKERQRYADEMAHKAAKSKEARAAAKRARAEERSRKAKAADKPPVAQKAAQQKKGFFARFRTPKAAPADDAGAASDDAGAQGGASATKAGQ